MPKKIQLNALFRLNDRKDVPQSFFCSELVGTTLQMMGILEEGLDMANLTPSDFAMSNRITDVPRLVRPFRDSQWLPRPFYLPLRGHAHYGPLINIDFNLNQEECPFTSPAGATDALIAKYGPWKDGIAFSDWKDEDPPADTGDVSLELNATENATESVGAL